MKNKIEVKEVDTLNLIYDAFIFIYENKLNRFYFIDRILQDKYCFYNISLSPEGEESNKDVFIYKDQKLNLNLPIISLSLFSFTFSDYSELKRIGSSIVHNDEYDRFESCIFDKEMKKVFLNYYSDSNIFIL